jgi:hypothetical protein
MAKWCGLETAQMASATRFLPAILQCKAVMSAGNGHLQQNLQQLHMETGSGHKGA